MDERLLQRITVDKNVRNGKPVIRNMRFTVSEILDMLASGMSKEEITHDYPYIEPDDIDACILYASKVLNNETDQLVVP